MNPLFQIKLKTIVNEVGYKRLHILYKTRNAAITMTAFLFYIVV